MPSLAALGSFAWSLCVMMITVAAMIIFRKPIIALIDRSHKVKAGVFSIEASKLDSIRRAVIREKVPGAKELDIRDLIIRDSRGRPRIYASTAESGQPFLALLDEDGYPRAVLSASANTDRDGVAMLTFPKRDESSIASFIGAEHDGTGAVGIQDRDGTWREM
jgi:hypothetical protein